MVFASICQSASAEDAPADKGPVPGISVEMNKLEAAGDDCRATFVIQNGLDEPLSALKLDLVVFDGQGIVARRLAADFAPLAAQKTAVKIFPVSRMACGDIDRVLLNDVLACEAADGAVKGCLDRLALHSRAAASFVK
ncbi:Tat pathway signal protein [Hartmannibacter diazotrophicus]|nr:Tat pathway signal protein [Hartmannibacter diazotrophicus]